MIEYKIRICGDKAVIVEFPGVPPKEANEMARWLRSELESSKIADCADLEVTMTTLSVSYDPVLCPLEKITYTVRRIISKNKDRTVFDDQNERKRVHYIPVCYTGQFAPDLSEAADALSLSSEELVEQNTSRDILVYAADPVEGLFLSEGGQDIPCAKTAYAPELSVIVRGRQTVIAPNDGEYRGFVIGRIAKGSLAGIEAGDYLRFVAVTENRFKKISENDKHEIKTRRVVLADANNGR